MRAKATVEEILKLQRHVDIIYQQAKGNREQHEFVVMFQPVCISVQITGLEVRPRLLHWM